MSIEVEVKKLRDEFEEHKKTQEEWNNEMLVMVKSNEETNKLLSENIIKVEQNTRPIVQLVKDFQGTARLGGYIKRTMLYFGFFGGVLAAAWTYLSDKF